MDYLGALRMFVRAVEVGSFSKAAIATNAKTSTVSRAIASLEEDLGVSLFHRTTRRAHLTEPGATFYEHARGVLRGLEEARDAASAMEGRPQGLIRLHIPSGFGRLHIMPFVPDFLASYPDIRLDVSLTDVRVDLLSVGADLAIRELVRTGRALRKPARAFLHAGDQVTTWNREMLVVGSRTGPAEPDSNTRQQNLPP
jgi:DNA-binding transcriptional LysR family regulator